MRFFNTAGPINPQDHYFVPNRSNESQIRDLIDQKKYFVLHAPRQTGKTSGILSLTDTINSEGKYTALYVNLEPIQAARNDYKAGIIGAVDLIRQAQKFSLNQEIPWTAASPLSALQDYLSTWASQHPKPIVLFLDEIDSLVGDTLISVLRQLRAGYNYRPHHFPSSICLIGVRNIRDYPSDSAFNISAESLFLKTFDLEQVRALYDQHTQETGQIFTPDAVQYAFDQTQGQPWLVNALAYEACFEQVQDRTKPITQEVFERAKETLIIRRDTHLDVLIDRLRETRVRNVISTILLGKDAIELPQDDLSYSIDLGLIRRDEFKNLVIANPIYQEVIPRELTHVIQATMTQQTSWYVKPDKTLDMPKLLDAFVQFYRENAEVLLENFGYKEAGPHLIMMAFLQRVINGGGKIYREYALGRRRADLLVEFENQRFVIELKMRRNEKTLDEGLIQTADYMDKNKSDEGHLIIFDQRSDQTWEQKISKENHNVGSKIITVWGL